jgi:NAD+ synthase
MAEMNSSIRAKLVLDEAKEIERIATRVRSILVDDVKRRGLVVAVSGGIDSAVCAALAVRAVGKDKVFGLLLPERDSASTSSLRGRMVVEQLGITYQEFDIAPALEALGCYQWRDAAIRNVFQEYSAEWKSKIVIAGGQSGQFNYFKLVVQAPDGHVAEARLDHKNYLQIVAATNFKQRVRKTLEYFHADRLHFAVVGTPNRLEYDQGFFVKNGDGSADIKPIAHLYKSQVYQLAHYLQLPEEICRAEPSTDTYSMAQGQDEFYFSMSYEKMDVALLAYNEGESPLRLSCEIGISVEQAEAVYKDIEAKRRTTAPLHWPAILVDNVVGPMTRHDPKLVR